jgi:hypothetical protein
MLRSIVFQDSEHELDDVFVYGYDLNDSGLLLLGDGSIRCPCYAAFSTKRMIQVIQHAIAYPLPVVLHIDATFKLNENEFPFIVLGITDARQQFFPLAFAVVSRINQEMNRRVLVDFKCLVASVCNGLNFKPNYVMINADAAERNACIEVLGLEEHQVLVCFFHVQKNVKEKSRRYSAEIQQSILSDVRLLRNATSMHVYQDKWREIKLTWLNSNLVEFATYFENQ